MKLDWIGEFLQGRYIRMTDNIDLPNGKTFDFILSKRMGIQILLVVHHRNSIITFGMVWFVVHHHHDVHRFAVDCYEHSPGCLHVSKFILCKEGNESAKCHWWNTE